MDLTKIDLFSDENLENPWDILRELRDAGPATYMEAHDIWAVPRYAEVRAALGDWPHFTSRYGASVSRELDELNFKGAVLFVDPPRHDELSKVLRANLSPGALREVTAEIEEGADAAVSELVAREEFDAVRDLADRFPVEVVADLLGLPREGREDLRKNAAAGFNMFGPNNKRTQDSMPDFEAIGDYIANGSARENLSPGSFGMALYEAVDAGDLLETDIIHLMAAYLVAGMDTTVNAVGSVVWKLAENAGQWQLLRENPKLVKNAFDEALRIEPPLMGFTRTLVEDREVGGVPISAGEKILPLLNSANRDERRWEDPETFDITRDNSGHLTFGFGLHACTGRVLAHIEGQAVLKALVRQVDSIEIVGPVTRRLHNIVRGLDSLPLKVEPVGARVS